MRCLAAFLTSPLGAWLCLSLTCHAPDPALAGYFKAPMLLVTVHGRPWATIECDLLRETHARGETWSEWTCT
jgi:hypothetical protein